MAIVINANPGIQYSANGDLIFTVYESVKANDPVTYPDYKYVADIYIGVTLVARLKKVPQPDNKRGVFNIGNIVRNYLATTFNPDPLTFQAQQLGLTEFFINATVKFGEEYGFVLYTNRTVDAERIYYNHYNGRMLGATTILPSVLDKAASARPYAGAVGRDSNSSFIPYFPSSASPITITVSKYGSGPTTPYSNVEWGYFATDPTTGIDSRSMQFSLPYAYGANALNINYTSVATGMYLVLKEKITQPVKTTWFNTTFNNGTIPDYVFKAPVTIGLYRYYISRIPVVLDSTTYSIVFGNGSPAPPSPVGAVSFTTTITPTNTTPAIAPGSTLVLTEATSPNFINGDGQLKINGAIFQDIFSSGSIAVNLPIGASYSFEAYNNTATSASNPKIRLKVTKGATVIFDSQISAAPGASIIKTGVVKNAAYRFEITTVDTTTPVTPIDIDDNDPVPFTMPLQILNLSPGVINNYIPNFIDDSVDYYTVQIGSGNVLRYNVICEPRYQKYNIHFLNRYGGFDTKLFSKVSRKTIDVAKSSFSQLPYKIDSNGAVSYNNANGVYHETKSTYSSQYTEKLILNSDLLNDAEYTWLADLIISPLVYVEMNGYFVPCSITQSNYEFKKVVNDKLTNLTIDVEFGDQFNAQYR
jgi:hypothetical protein